MTEALHPFNVFRDAGFEVDLVSETGSYQADWLSQQEDWLKGEDRKVWEDPNSEFRKKLDAHLKPSDIDASKVGSPPSITCKQNGFSSGTKAGIDRALASAS